MSFDSSGGAVLRSRWIQLQAQTKAAGSGSGGGGDIISRGRDLLLLRLGAASSPDRHRLAVLVEASSAAVDVGVGGRRHRLLPGPDGLSCEEDGGNHRWFPFCVSRFLP